MSLQLPVHHLWEWAEWQDTNRVVIYHSTHTMWCTSQWSPTFFVIMWWCLTRNTMCFCSQQEWTTLFMVSTHRSSSSCQPWISCETNVNVSHLKCHSCCRFCMMYFTHQKMMTKVQQTGRLTPPETSAVYQDRWTGLNPPVGFIQPWTSLTLRGWKEENRVFIEVLNIQ